MPYKRSQRRTCQRHKSSCHSWPYSKISPSGSTVHPMQDYRVIQLAPSLALTFLSSPRLAIHSFLSLRPHRHRPHSLPRDPPSPTNNAGTLTKPEGSRWNTCRGFNLTGEVCASGVLRSTMEPAARGAWQRGIETKTGGRIFSN